MFAGCQNFSDNVNASMCFRPITYNQKIDQLTNQSDDGVAVFHPRLIALEYVVIRFSIRV